jgi:hypothetical protein
MPGTPYEFPLDGPGETQHTETTNLCVDPGFEGYDPSNPQWTLGAGYTVETASPRSGSKHLRAAPASTNLFADNCNLFDCVPGQKFPVYAYVKADAADADRGVVRVGMKFYDADMTLLTHSIAEATSQGDAPTTYTRLGTTGGVSPSYVTAPANAVFARFSIRIVSMSAGTWDIDDCFVGRLIGPSDLDSGGDYTMNRLLLGESTAPPLVVGSTAMVENLNAEMLGGQALADLDARYAPTSHTHTASEITDFDSAADARADARIAAADTDDVDEGASNLYFTNARARSALSGTAKQVGYNSSTGVFSLARLPLCRVYHSADQTTTSGSPLILAFNSERYDTDGMHDTAANNTRITFQTAGFYYVTLGATFASNATGYRVVNIKLNGASSYIASNSVAAANGNATRVVVSCLYYFSAGDYIEAEVTQNSGGSLAVSSSSAFNSAFQYSPEFSAHFVSVGPAV